MKNWKSIVNAGSVIVLHNVPETLYDGDGDHEYYSSEIVPDKTFDRKALEVEKEKLIARLKEIETLLA